MWRDLFLCLVAAAIVAVASYAGLLGYLGAHPWWQSSVGFIGGAIGGGFAFLLRLGNWSGPLPALIGAALTLITFGVAHSGKTRFAASFAEDATAGQMWYFGWIATAAFAAITLALVLRRR